jgi:hypothetical protein
VLVKRIIIVMLVSSHGLQLLSLLSSMNIGRRSSTALITASTAKVLGSPRKRSNTLCRKASRSARGNDRANLVKSRYCWALKVTSAVMVSPAK